MTLQRTNSGLSNQYLFWRVDAVVLLEGGQINYTLQEIEDGYFNIKTLDIYFWEVLFKSYFPEKSYHYRSIGSKENLKVIAGKIKTGKISRVIVAMDRDFDHINNAKVQSNNVLYTYGYSWENDCWCEATTLEAYCTLSGSSKSSIRKEVLLIQSIFQVYCNQLNRAVLMDAVLSQYADSFFDRKGVGRYLTTVKGRPVVDISQIKATLKKARKKNPPPVFRKTKLSTGVQKDCYGHLLAMFYLNLLCYLLKKSGSGKISKKMVTNLILEKFSDLFTANKLANVKPHYDKEFQKVTI